MPEDPAPITQTLEGTDPFSGGMAAEVSECWPRGQWPGGPVPRGCGRGG